MDTDIPHLVPLPADTVNALCDRAEAANLGKLRRGIQLEIDGFRRDRTPWDASRLANILSFTDLAPDIVRELDALAQKGGVVPSPMRRLRHQSTA